MSILQDANINLADNESMASFGRVIDVDALREELIKALDKELKTPSNSWYKDGFLAGVQDVIEYLLRIAPLDDYPEQRI